MSNEEDIERFRSALYTWLDSGAAKEFLASGPSLDEFLRTPIAHVQREIQLKRLEEMYASGDTGALLEAMYECCRFNVPLPPWLRISFQEAYLKVAHFKEPSWESVFGKPLRKGKQTDAARKKLELAIPVYVRVCEIRKDNPDQPIDAGLFEMVGEELGLKKTQTEEYYYLIKNSFGSPELNLYIPPLHRTVQDDPPKE